MRKLTGYGFMMEKNVIVVVLFCVFSTRVLDTTISRGVICAVLGIVNMFERLQNE